MIYKTELTAITPNQLNGFFVDWPNPPNLETHLNVLKQSSHIVLALDQQTNQVVGFITAISDGILSAYIPLLEVLPSHQHQGIGQELVKRMLTQLSEFYMIDLCCDEDLAPFYEKHAMRKGTGMHVRNYSMQAGR